MIRRPAGLFDTPPATPPATQESVTPTAEPVGAAKTLAESVDALASMREIVKQLGETLEAKLTTTIDGINQRLDKLQRRLDDAIPAKGLDEPVPEKIEAPVETTPTTGAAADAADSTVPT